VAIMQVCSYTSSKNVFYKLVPAMMWPLALVLQGSLTISSIAIGQDKGRS